MAKFIRQGKMSFRAIKAFVCLETGWTESQFLEQKWRFINEIIVFLDEKNKQMNGK